MQLPLPPALPETGTDPLVALAVIGAGMLIVGVLAIVLGSKPRLDDDDDLFN